MKILGIDIRIDLSWIIIFLLVTWTFAFGYFPVLDPELSLTSNIVFGTITSIIFFASIVIHELSHSVVARRNNLAVNIITLFIFGGASHLEDEPPTPWIEFKMAAAGPVSSLILGAVFIGLAYIPGMNLGLFSMFQILGIVNLILGVFNLLPGFPLDGGRVFRSIIWHFNKNYLRATEISVYGGQVVALGIMLWGIVSIITSGFVVGGVWLMVIGFFLYSLAGISYRQTEAKEKLSKIKIKDMISQEYAIVPPGAKVSSIFSSFQNKKTDTIFTGENGKVDGFLKYDDVREMDEEEAVQEVFLLSHNLPEEEILKPSGDALKAVKYMQKEDISCLPVEEGKKIEGIVCRSEILAALRYKV